MNRKVYFTSTILILLGVLLFTLTCFISPIKISGQSMEPTLKDGAIHFINRLDKNIRPGDIIVIKSPNDQSYWIKRVIAVKGDHVAQLSSGVVYVNDEIKINTISTRAVEEKSFKILDGFFVIGDNTVHSFDSRNVGVVPPECLIGKLIT